MTSTEHLIGGTLIVSYPGKTPDPLLLEKIETWGIAGMTLFRHFNYEHPAQVRAYTDTLQAAARAAGQLPLLIAADQEGGQLHGLGAGMTMFPGNMALGATGDLDLAYRVGVTIGTECAALGVNINYGPVADVNSNPANPNVGVRAFGDDPALVGPMVAAMVAGLQEAGVAATAKHFPGNGESPVDSHYEVPVLNLSRERLDAVELPPFRAAIDAGVKLLMTGHVGVPALTDDPHIPATVSDKIIGELLREEMGYQGVVITDSLEMGAIDQGLGQVLDALAALRAGVDLLMLGAGLEREKRLFDSLCYAYRRRLLDPDAMAQSRARVHALRTWVGQQPQPSLDVVNSEAHQQVALEVAQKALTLVRNEHGLLPLQLGADDKVLVLLPTLADLTPADTSSADRHTLANALRRYHPNVDEVIYPRQPREQDIAPLLDKAARYDVVILGTISAHLQKGQGDLATALLSQHDKVITVALRTPYDLLAYDAPTHVCTYSHQPPSMAALAAGLVGEIEMMGKLPVNLANLTPQPLRVSDSERGLQQEM